MHAKWLYKRKWMFTIDHALHLSKGHNIPEHKVECVLIKFFELREVKFIILEDIQWLEPYPVPLTSQSYL